VAVFNQYSFVWLGAASILVLAILLAVRRSPAQQWLAPAALAVGLCVAYVLLRPTPASPEASQLLESALGSGTPLLLELQSPY
jgi:hypothetical protein